MGMVEEQSDDMAKTATQRPKAKNKPYTSSRAMVIFGKTISRARTFEVLYETTVKSHSVSHPADLIRATVTFSVAAMDAYFTDRFCESLVPFLKNRRAGKDLIHLVREAGVDTEQVLILLTMKRPYRRIRTLVSAYLERRTTQRLDAIDELFLCFGLPEFTKRVEGSMGKKTALARVEKLVERRHQIVHDGDMNEHGKVRPITKATFSQLDTLEEFVTAADKLLYQALTF